MPLDHPVLVSLLPVMLLIALGFVAGRLKLMRAESVRDLSNFVFLLLLQALLFRTMATVDLARLDLASVALYYVVTSGLFLALLFGQGPSSRAAMLALAGVFSNAVMIGVPLVQLAYGSEGLAVLFALVSLHALVVLSLATVATELLLAREQANSGQGTRPRLLATLGRAVKNTLLHPVPLPIIAGLLYALTGLGLHPVIDRPLKLLGDAFGPVALVLVGLTLSYTSVGPHLKTALRIACLKNLLHPLLMAAAGWALGLRGMTLTVLIVTAALPVGANVFLFSQRYRQAEDLVTASMAVSTLMAVFTLSLIMSLLAWAGG